MARKKKSRDRLFKKQWKNYAVNGNRWYNGKQVTKDTPGAKPVVTESEEWYTRISDRDGKRTEHRLCTDKSAALIMRGELLRKIEMGTVKAVDPFDAAKKRLLSEHLADFAVHLTSKGNTPKHVRLTISRVQAVFTACGFRKLTDVETGKVEKHLAALRTPAEDGTQGMGVNTTNHILTALKNFGGWLLREKRVAINPFVHMRRMNAAVDVRRERRSLSADELTRLISAAQSSPKSQRFLSGPDRAMLYELAAFTGLRAQECASLTSASFDLRANPPTVTVAAGYSKHRRQDVLPLHPGLAVRLQGWLASKHSDDGPTIRIDARREPVRLWPGTWWGRAADMIRFDLAAARGSWLKEAGRDIEEQLRRVRTDFLHVETRKGVADFHALRHSFCTMVANSGVHPSVAKELARHSTITLTMDRYSHVGLADMNAALKTVPSLPKTGTDGR